MTYQELRTVKKYDSRRMLLGAYNSLFIQNGCEEIQDDFIANVHIKEQFYESMLKDFAIYDVRVIAKYNASSIRNFTVYHVSYGKMGESSLSVFFRIYAIEVNTTGTVIQASGEELYSVVNINVSSGNTKIKLRRSDGEIPGIEVNMKTGIFAHGGRLYRAVMEITGVGSHVENKQGAFYRLAVRNERLFPDAGIML
ncbi:MAG: hypothetical protein K2M20_11095 [Lachnospiraceae bacterium]|nr:hypothetical protein [Lachnospiraceae bacterium]